MGINAELVKLVAGLRRDNAMDGDCVIELGAQDVCVIDDVVSAILSDSGLGPLRKKIERAQDLYGHLGFQNYQCIDANGENGALLFDLNNDLRENSFDQTFDLVTNLGTAEHCFDQRAVFKNLHDLCRPGGIMIHALPAQGNVNHAFYNYHPRFFADLAAANGYEVIDLTFTVDYKSDLIRYSIDEFRKWDSHDVLFYAVFRKIGDGAFCLPFDGMFATKNRLAGYASAGENPLVTEFSPYLKTGNWENTRGVSASKQSPAAGGVSAFLRRLFSV